MTQPLLRTLGDFELIREFGRGGLSVIYEPRQVSLKRKLALKVLKVGLGLTTEAVKRFQREAAAAVKLHHANIVPIYATGEDGDYHFYAMELIVGSSLDQVIRWLIAERANPVAENAIGTVASKSKLTQKPLRSDIGESADQLAATFLDDLQTETLNPKPEALGETTTTLPSGSGYFDTV